MIRRFARAIVLSLVACACGDDAPESSPALVPAGATTADSARARDRDARRSSEAGAREWFRDATAASGVDFVHDAGTTPEKHLPETMGAGCALVDFDADGDLDLYFVQSGPMRGPGKAPGTYAEPAGKLPTNRLYRNDGGMRFTDVTAASGAAADTRYGMGVAAGDFDRDGNVDLYLTNLGADVLLKGDGKGGFSDATTASGLRDERWTSGATFFDADGDLDLDLFVTSYVEVDLARPEWCGERKAGWRSYCHPDRYPGIEDRFWRNRGDGTFVDETTQAGFSDPNGKGLCVLASDVDQDGDVDLYVANDSTENRLYLNRGDATFEDATLLSGTGVDRYGRTEASMGVASGDTDGDLDLDLFVTGFDDESDTLYANEGGALFEDATVATGLELATRLPVGFGTVLEDLDNDGDLDLAIANGHIIDNIALYHDAKTHAQPALLYENDGKGRFADVSAAAGALCATPFVGRGLYAGDLDQDGDLDLVLTQCGGAARLFENLRGGRSVEIVGLPPGTRVVAETASGRQILRESGPQPSYFGQSAASVRLGSASEPFVSLRIRRVGSAEEVLALDPPIVHGVVRVRVDDGRIVVTR